MFTTLGLLGHDEEKFRHDGFGLVSLPEGKMSTREGRVIFLEDLIKEAIERAEKNCRREKLRTDRYGKKEIASAVGIGAVCTTIFHKAEKKIFIHMGQSIKYGRSSAPYLRRVCARDKYTQESGGCS